MEKLERERAALDLTDAAQADTQAADLDRDEAAESRRLTRLTQRLYANADTHHRHAGKAHRQDRPLTATPSALPADGHGQRAPPPKGNYRL